MGRTWARTDPAPGLLGNAGKNPCRSLPPVGLGALSLWKHGFEHDHHLRLKHCTYSRSPDVHTLLVDSSAGCQSCPIRAVCSSLRCAESWQLLLPLDINPESKCVSACPCRSSANVDPATDADGHRVRTLSRISEPQLVPTSRGWGCLRYGYPTQEVDGKGVSLRI